MATVLVTGGGRGIGRSSVLAFANAGFDVVVNYSRSERAAREVAKEAEQARVKTLVVQADVADESAVRAMAETIGVRFGRLDVLVNNANTTTDTPPSDLDGLSMADWDRVFAVNVRGTFQVTRACAPLLRASAPASVINLASVVGMRPGPQPFPYAASKAAIVNLTRTLAGALGPEIRVNAVAPGWMAGECMEHALGDDYEALVARRAKRTPLRRCVTPDKVAATILSLATGNPFVNGETVVVDGGYTATM